QGHRCGAPGGHLDDRPLAPDAAVGPGTVQLRFTGRVSCADGIAEPATRDLGTYFHLLDHRSNSCVKVPAALGPIGAPKLGFPLQAETPDSDPTARSCQLVRRVG